MKNFFSLLLLLLIMQAANAQLVSKRGESILPEKGSWGVFFDAVPFIEYAGNVLNASGNNTVVATYPNGYPLTLVLKHYKTDNRALRIKLRANFTSNSIDSIVVFLGGIDPEPSVTDSRTVAAKNFAVGIGMQNSRSKGRLTGYIGRELLIGFSGRDTTYTYGGGPLTPSNWMHTVTFGQERGVTSIEQGTTFSINFHLVFGVEYFFAPKMSLSAEYSWGLGYSKTGEGKISSEQWDFQGGGKVKTTTEKIPGGKSFRVDNANNVGSINLAFYF
jgi:hypothetical protein